MDMSKFCQSCSMPLEKDAQGGGTEADGSKSKKYCSSCYENGALKDPNMTMDEMKKIVDEKMREAGMSWFMRWMAKMMLPKLERWKK